MKIETKIIEPKIPIPTPEKTYPWVGKSIHYGNVVVFESPRRGTVLVKGGGSSDFGHISDCWTEELFVPLPAGTQIIILPICYQYLTNW